METKELRLHRRLWQTRLCSIRRPAPSPVAAKVMGFASAQPILRTAALRASRQPDKILGSPQSITTVVWDCIFNERWADCDRIMAFLRRSKSAI
jgi:hypothetical protein